MLVSLVDANSSVERLHWNVLREKEAAKLSADAGIDDHAGLVHSIDPQEVRHSFARHGDPATEASRQGY